MNAKRLIALATILTLILSLGEHMGSPVRAVAAASCPLEITSYDDFQNCISTSDSSGIHISDAGGGAVELAAVFSDDFPGTSLDNNKWTQGIWGGGSGTVTVENSAVTIPGSANAYIQDKTEFPQPSATNPTVMEAVINFGAGDYQNVGFAQDLGTVTNWILFSTHDPQGGVKSGIDLFARLSNNGGEKSQDLGTIPAGYHRYRIEWLYDGSFDTANYYIDGDKKATLTLDSGTRLPNSYLYISNNGGAGLSADIIQAAPNYATSGAYESTPVDAGAGNVFTTMSWDATLPSGTGLTVETQTSPDGTTWPASWSDPISSGATIPNPDRFMRFRLDLSTSDATVTPLVNSITLNVAQASADLSITKTAPPSVNAGDAFSYTIEVTNKGPDPAVNVKVSDPLPDGVTYVDSSGTDWTCQDTNGTVVCSYGKSLPPGTAPTLTLNVTAPNQGATLTNTASVTSDTMDPGTSNNNSNEAVTTVNPVADLSINKTADVSFVMPNGEVNYTIAVHNYGPSDASEVIVTDTLPSGSTLAADPAGTGWDCSATSGQTVSCTLSTLTAGQDALPLSVKINAPDQTGKLANTASVASAVNEPDPDPHSNSSTVTIPVELANLKITKTASQPTVLTDESFYYTLIIDESGDAARSPIVTDTLPTGVSYVSSNAPVGWNCSFDPGLHKVTCTYDRLLDSGTYEITIHVTAPDQPGSISNTAEITAENAVSESSQVDVSVQTHVFLPLIVK